MPDPVGKPVQLVNYLTLAPVPGEFALTIDPGSFVGEKETFSSPPSPPSSIFCFNFLNISDFSCQGHARGSKVKLEKGRGYFVVVLLGTRLSGEDDVQATACSGSAQRHCHQAYKRNEGCNDGGGGGR